MLIWLKIKQNLQTSNALLWSEGRTGHLTLGAFGTKLPETLSPHSQPKARVTNSNLV